MSECPASKSPVGGMVEFEISNSLHEKGTKKLKQYMKRGHINDPIDREYNIWLYKAILHKLELSVLSTVPLLFCLGWLYSSARPGCSQP